MIPSHSNHSTRTPARRGDLDLGKLHAVRKYNPHALREQVPWYRNSFEDAAVVPTTELPPEPVEIEPPLVIPKDLRPLGYKRHYLRTIQLIQEPSPLSSGGDGGGLHEPAEASSSFQTIPFEKTLRKDTTSVPKAASLAKQKNTKSKDLFDQQRKGMKNRSVSFPILPQQQLGSSTGTGTNRTAAAIHEVADDDDDDEAAEEDEADGEDARPMSSPRLEAFGRREQTLASIKCAGRLSPLHHHQHHRSSKGATERALLRRPDRERSRRVSVEETEDLRNSDCYFGPTSKTQFFAQYRHLYSKPYLFMEDPSLHTSPRFKVRDSDGYLAIPTHTQSNFQPAYPSSSFLKGVEHKLASAGSGVEFSGLGNLPTEDSLSPRSQFLTAGVTRPQIVKPFMMRQAMTKVYDFSFQSLGDQLMIEFANCLKNELPYVEEINVRDNRLSDDGLDILLQAISRGGSTMLHLHRLDISQNVIGRKSAQTLRSFVVSSYCSLKALLMDTADIDDHECAAFMTAFEKNLSIKELFMSRNCIGKAEHLNVVQPHFVTGGEAIASMLGCNLVLVHLDVSWNYLRLASSITLAKSIVENRTLVELNVAYNACGDAGAMVFGEALLANQCLEVLNLAYNSIGCKGAQVLAYALRGNRTLRSLKLDGNCIGRQGGQQLMAALCENKNEFGCDLSLHACNLSSSMIVDGSNSSGGRVAPLSLSGTGGTASSSGGGSTTTSTPGGPKSPSAPGGGDSTLAASLPAYGASSHGIFSSKEPTGRYTLHLHDPYDKMMAAELMRLAMFKKGCRFLKLEHRATAGAPKKAIQLVRKERTLPAKSAVSVPVAVPAAAAAAATASQKAKTKATNEETSFETLGLDALFTNVVDRDHSGFVDRQEVMRALNTIGLFPKMENLETVLAKFDFNHSGFLENGVEFASFFLEAVFQLLDTDSSGKIDADEVEEAFQMLGMEEYDEKDIVDAIALYDLTGDGEMEASEFTSFMTDTLLDRLKQELTVSASSKSDQDNSSGSSGSSGSASQPFVMLLESTTQRAWRIPEDGILEIDFLYEREAFCSIDEATKYAKIPQASIEKLIHNITDLADSKSEQEELFHVAVHDSDLKFTASQAYQLLDACGLLKPVDDSKTESIARILPQLLTSRDAQVLVSRTLTLRQRCRLKAEMGSAYSVIMGNPTAHYSFDLSKPKDRAALAKIAEIAQSEKLFSKHKSCRGDTSQHGNWENFRNEELDGVKIVLTTTFFHVMPRRGKLSFDYVSTSRPKKGTLPLSGRRFDQLITELQTSITFTTESPGEGEEEEGDEGEDKDPLPSSSSSSSSTSTAGTGRGSSAASTIGHLHAPPIAKTLSVRTKQTEFWDKTRSSVLKKAAWQFAVSSTSPLAGQPRNSTSAADFQFTTSRNTTKETVALKLVQIESSICDRWLCCEQAAQLIACMPDQFHAKPETARILFARLIDIDNFYQILDTLSPVDQYVCAKSLGWLNIVNPMAPERQYSLDVSIWDERELTKLLVQLAIAEPGENWINQSFSMARGEPGIPGWKLPVRWEKEDEKDGGGVNKAGYLEVEYYSGQDNGCAPVPAFRKTLMGSVLAGTKLFCL